VIVCVRSPRRGIKATAKAIAWLRSNFDKPLRVEELAEVARMGTSTLHHHFRALTAMSPLQYQKWLRLHAARDRMLTGGLDAASAAFEVGYESASQFSREYRRLFGQPPMTDVKAHRLATENNSFPDDQHLNWPGTHVRLVDQYEAAGAADATRVAGSKLVLE